jgi:hypothetical protein
MKRKPLIGLALILVLTFSFCLLATHSIDAQAAPIISIVPSGSPGATSTTDIAQVAVGSTFSVDVRVDDYANVIQPGSTVYGVDGVSYEIFWNPVVLKLKSCTDGSWLPDQLDTDITSFASNGNLTIGQIAADTSNAWATNNAASGAVSSTLVFQVLTTGSSAITLAPQKGVAYLAAPQATGGLIAGENVPGVEAANAQYGLVSTTSSIHGPTAAFTPISGSIFKIGTSITLNASSSLPGNDTQVCPIINYSWSIEDLNGTTVTSLTGVTATFSSTIDGTFRVILIVTANDVEANPSPSYISTASTSALINVVSSLQLVNVDVYTNEGGIGQEVSGGAYGPLQTVQTYASVTSNNSPLPDETVAFTVLEPNGTIYSSLSNESNTKGIATTSFRIPSLSFGPFQTDFGTWSITAVVDVSGFTVNDTSAITVSYLNGIENVTIPATILKGETLPIQLTVNNQELSAQWGQLSITLFDNAGIPIGSSTITVTQQVQEITVVNTAIIIPTWAFAGPATAYLCLLSNSTNVPVAPETIANFSILS